MGNCLGRGGISGDATVNKKGGLVDDSLHLDTPQRGARPHTPEKRDRRKRGSPAPKEEEPLETNEAADVAVAVTPTASIAQETPPRSRSSPAAAKGNGEAAHHAKSSPVPSLSMEETGPSRKNHALVIKNGSGNAQAPAESSQDATPDSVAVRLVQGSMYVWLRPSYANPHLRARPLLTAALLRSLRRPRGTLTRLWDVLGEAACVIGAFAAPSPVDSAVDQLSPNPEPSLVIEEPQTRRLIGATTASAGMGAARTTLSSLSTLQSENPMEEVRELSRDHVSISGNPSKSSTILCRGPAFRDRHLWVDKLRHRSCFVLEQLREVEINDCRDAFIVLGPTTGAVSISNCHRCFIVAVAAQVRVLSSDSLLLSLHVTAFPVIEKTSKIGVAPLLGWYAYAELPLHFRLAGISPFTNNFSTVRDVTPPAPPVSPSSPSPHSKNVGGHPLGNMTTSVGGSSVASATSTPSPSLLPKRHFVYLDPWELEAAVWRTVAEQRWRQLLSESGAAVGMNEQEKASPAASAACSPLVVHPSKGQLQDRIVFTASADEDGALGKDGQSGTPFMTVRSGAPSIAEEDDVSAEGEEKEEKLVPSKPSRRSEDGEEEPVFHSMISFGHLTQYSTIASSYTQSADVRTKTQNSGRGGGASGAVTEGTPITNFNASHHQHEQEDDNGRQSVKPLPRWRQPGFGAGASPTSGGPNSSSGGGGTSERVNSPAVVIVGKRQRAAARSSEQLVRTVLRAVPLLPLSALPDAASWLIAQDQEVPVKNTGPAAAKSVASSTADGGGGSRYNPLELNLALYTCACAAPSSFGAQLIPAEFFEQRWKLKLMVLSNKGGGYDLALRIVRDIEQGRRNCFLETVHAMVHEPPPSLNGRHSPGLVDSGRDRRGNAKNVSMNLDSGGSSAHRRHGKHHTPCSVEEGPLGEPIGTGEDEEENEDAFSEAMWHYLRTTSLTQRCGPALLLNAVELRCTEAAVREFVAPVFYKLSAPSDASAEETDDAGGGNGGVHHNNNNSGGIRFPWRASSGGGGNNSSSGGGGHSHRRSSSSGGRDASSPSGTEDNVAVRRLFGNAIQRMTGQTCVLLLALVAPTGLPPSMYQPSNPKRSDNGSALTPSELDAWMHRAQEAAYIFTPRKDENESETSHPQPPPQHAPQQQAATVHFDPTVVVAPAETIKENMAVAGAGKEKGGHQASLSSAANERPPLAEGTVALSTEERVWPSAVLLNVTVPFRYVSLLQGMLFFKSQLRSTAGGGGGGGGAGEKMKRRNDSETEEKETSGK